MEYIKSLRNNIVFRAVCWGLYLSSWFFFAVSLASFYLMDDREVGLTIYGLFLGLGIMALAISEVAKVIDAVFMWKELIARHKAKSSKPRS